MRDNRIISQLSGVTSESNESLNEELNMEEFYFYVKVTITVKKDGGWYLNSSLIQMT